MSVQNPKEITDTFYIIPHLTDNDITANELLQSVRDNKGDDVTALQHVLDGQEWTDKDLMAATYLAIKNKRVAGLKCLLQHREISLSWLDYSDNNNVLHLAASASIQFTGTVGPRPWVGNPILSAKILEVLLEFMDEGLLARLANKPNQNKVPPLGLHVDFNLHLTAKTLLKKGANVNGLTGSEQDTALLVAARQGHFKLVSLLLESGADVNATNNQLRTALHVLFDPDFRLETRGKRYTKCLHLILEAGAKIDLVDYLGASPLMLAARAGAAEAVNILLDKGSDADVLDCEDRSALDHALRNKRWDECAQNIVRAILAHQKKPNCDNTLSVVIYFDRAAMFKVFYEHDWDVLTGGKYGKTFLHSAANHGSINCLEAVFECDPSAQAYVNTEDQCGMTPLNIACGSGHAEVVRFLLSRGATINTANPSACTPLLSVLPLFPNKPVSYVYKDVKKVLWLLLKHGCDVDFKGYLNESQWKKCCEWEKRPHPALSWALVGGRTEAVRALWVGGTSRDCLHSSSLEAAFVSHQRDLIQETRAECEKFIQDCLNTPRSLQECCRAVIRKAICTNIPASLKLLPLPDKLKAYLALPELDQLLDVCQESDDSLEEGVTR